MATPEYDDSGGGDSAGDADYPWDHVFTASDEWNTPRAWRPFIRELSKRTLAVWGWAIYPGAAGFAANGPPAVTGGSVLFEAGGGTNGRYVGRGINALGGFGNVGPTEPATLWQGDDGLPVAVRVTADTAATNTLLGSNASIGSCFSQNAYTGLKLYLNGDSGGDSAHESGDSGPPGYGPAPDRRPPKALTNLSWLGIQQLVLQLSNEFVDPALKDESDAAFWTGYGRGWDQPGGQPTLYGGEPFPLDEVAEGTLGTAPAGCVRNALGDDSGGDSGDGSGGDSMGGSGADPAEPTGYGRPLPYSALAPFWPGPCGFGRHREREITRLDVPGRSGQRARFIVQYGGYENGVPGVYPFGNGRYQDPAPNYNTATMGQFGPYMRATPTDQHQYAQLIMDYGPPPLATDESGNPYIDGPGGPVNGHGEVGFPQAAPNTYVDSTGNLEDGSGPEEATAAVWHVSPDQASPPDILEFYGPGVEGDLITPAFLNELKAAINQLNVQLYRSGGGVAADWYPGWFACPDGTLRGAKNAVVPDGSGGTLETYSPSDCVYPHPSAVAPAAYSAATGPASVYSFAPSVYVRANLHADVTAYVYKTARVGDSSSSGPPDGIVSWAIEKLKYQWSGVGASLQCDTCTGTAALLVGPTVTPAPLQVTGNQQGVVTYGDPQYIGVDSGENATQRAANNAAYAYIDWTAGFNASGGGYGSGDPPQFPCDPIPCVVVGPVVDSCVPDSGSDGGSQGGSNGDSGTPSTGDSGGGEQSGGGGGGGGGTNPGSTGADGCVQFGKSGTYVAGFTGELTLLFNDSADGDNSGSWTINWAGTTYTLAGTNSSGITIPVVAGTAYAYSVTGTISDNAGIGGRDFSADGTWEGARYTSSTDPCPDEWHGSLVGLVESSGGGSGGGSSGSGGGSSGGGGSGGGGSGSAGCTVYSFTDGLPPMNASSAVTATSSGLLQTDDNTGRFILVSPADAGGQAIYYAGDVYIDTADNGTGDFASDRVIFHAGFFSADGMTGFSVRLQTGYSDGGFFRDTSGELGPRIPAIRGRRWYRWVVGVNATGAATLSVIDRTDGSTYATAATDLSSDVDADHPLAGRFGQLAANYGSGHAIYLDNLTVCVGQSTYPGDPGATVADGVTPNAPAGSND